MRRKRRGEWARSRRRDGRCQKPEEAKRLYREICQAGGLTRSQLATRLGWPYWKVLRQLMACEALGLTVAEGPRGRLYEFGEELGPRRVWLAEALAEAWRAAG